MTTHRISDNEPKRNVPVARVLPFAAREILLEAARSPKIGRAKRIDEATANIKQKYPQFFK